MSNTVASAEHRALDVYVGIDIFGRNTFGGGKFNSYKVLLKNRPLNEFEVFVMF